MRTFRLFVTVLFSVIGIAALGNRGIFQSGVTINGNFHDCTGNTSAWDLPHSVFGKFHNGDAINLSYAEVYTWKNSGSDNCPPIMHYRIYRTCDTPGSFTSVTLDWANNFPDVGSNAGDQQWNKNLSLNLLSGLTLPGTYVFEMYFEVPGQLWSSGCSQSIYDNNGSVNNYRAYFEYEMIDSFSTPTALTSWNSNNINNFTIVNNSTVSNLTGSEPSRTLTVRLNSSYSGGSLESNYLSTQIATWGSKQEWSFWHGRHSTPSNISQTYFWLYADQSDLNSNTISGYRIKFGNNSTPDVFVFQKVSAGVETNLATSSTGVGAGLTDFGISFLVSRSATGVWNVYTTTLPQNSSQTQSSPTAYGSQEAAITHQIFQNLVDTNMPIALNSNGYLGFVATTNSNSTNRTGQEFDNVYFRVLPPDTYVEFASAANSIDEVGSGSSITVNIFNPSATLATSVEVYLISGDANRLNPSYVTETLTWPMGDNSPKTISVDAFDNLLCDDHATLVFGLQNPLGGNNASVGPANTHTLTILDDNMGYDDLLSEDFETSLPAAWISTPASRWVRSNTNPVGGSGYSVNHVNIASGIDSSSLAISMDSMPLTGVSTTWRFQVRFQQDGAAYTHWMTYLSANTTNLLNLSAVNGYAVGFNQNLTGGTSDPLCLYRVTNGNRTVLINTNLDWIDDLGANNAVSVEVTLDENGEWTLRVDANGGYDNFTDFGPVADLTHPIMNAFGIRYNFSAALSDQLKWDDVSITQKGCQRVWYSQSSGNSDGSIWWQQPSGGSTTVQSGRFDRFQIQNGHTVTASNGTWVMSSLNIDNGATLSAQSNSDIRLFGDWANDGTFNRSSSKVTFRGTQNQSILGSSINRFHNLVIDNDGGAVNVVVNDSIFVHNVLYMNEGTLNTNDKVAIYSNSTWTGSIGAVQPGAQVSGKVTLMRYIPSIPYQYGNWINIGNPLTGLKFTDWNASITTTGFPGSLFPPPYSFVNIRSYNEPTPGAANVGYQGVTNGNNTIMSEKGYLVWLNGSADILIGKGNIQTGNITHNLSYTNTNNAQGDGWNLMTNPYPSEVDWNRVSANLTGPRVYYVYDYSIGSFKWWQAIGNESGNGTASRYIPHCQSFFVKVNNSGETLNYQESYKTNNGTAFERSTGDSEQAVVAIQLESNGRMDENLLFFDANAQAGYDQRDVMHMASPEASSIQMYLLSEDALALSQDVRPYSGELSIAVFAKMPAAGVYHLRIPEVKNLPAGACLYLEDLITGDRIAVKNEEEMVITLSAPFEGVRFKITGNAAARVIATDATCHGVANGSIDVTVPATWQVRLNEEGHQFEYVSDGSVTLDGLHAGTYQLEVINPNSTCIIEPKTIVIGQPETNEVVITAIQPVHCNAGSEGAITWEVTESSWYSYELRNDQQQVVNALEVEGNQGYIDELPAGIYQLTIYTECSTLQKEVDLRDPSVPVIEVVAPQSLEMVHGTANAWLAIEVAQPAAIKWAVSNGQQGEGEMMEVVFDQEGVYTYRVIAEGSTCANTKQGEIVVKSATLNASSEEAVQINQYANQLEVVWGSDWNKSVSVRVLDAAGRQVYSTTIEPTMGRKLSIATNAWSTGIYTVQIAGDEELLHTQKVFRK